MQTTAKDRHSSVLARSFIMAAALMDSWNAKPPADITEAELEQVKIRLLLRDFEMTGIDKQKELLQVIVEKLRKKHPKAEFELEISESYKNMRYKVEEEPRLVAYAEEAIQRTDVKPYNELIRGGTDGARLSYMGLPCPNLYAGGEAIHSPREWVPVQVMEKATETIVHLSAIWAEKSL